MRLPQATGTRDRAFWPLFLGLSALAWLGLAAWHLSPQAHLLHPQPLGLGEVCRSGGGAGLAAYFMGGWVLMTVAMMLPTTVPLVGVFARLVRPRADRRTLMALLLAGYLLAWAGFGLLAYGAQALMHRLTDGSAWLWAHAWVVGTITLALAGAFQFSRLKYRCLDACRSPLPFALLRWRPHAPRRSALRLGVAHGLYCVGCCWALMLLMFTVGLGNLGWMLALAAAMAMEKNMPWGRRIARPLGIGLLGGAVATMAVALLG